MVNISIYGGLYMIQYTCVNRKGSQVLMRGICDDKDYKHKEFYKPFMFVRCREEHRTDSDFFGGPVKLKRFDNAYEMGQYIKNYSEIEGHLWGSKSVEHQYIYEKFGDTIEYDTNKVRIALIDIEVMTKIKTSTGWFDTGFPSPSEAKYPINAICHYDNLDDIYYQFTTAEWEKEKSIFPDIAEKTVYIFCESEEVLIKKWLNHWRQKTPHIVSGWNSELFDIPYIVNRIKNVFGENILKILSPWGIVEEKEVKTAYGVEKTYDIFGISSLDYMLLYKKHTFKMRKSYKLDYIAYVELGERKAKVEGDLGSFYWNNPQGFIDYNLNDVYLVKHLDDKLQLFRLVMALSYFAGLNYIDTFSPIKTWDTLIFRECLKNGVAIPFSEKRKGREEYEGAYVFDTKTGMQKYTVSFDLTSLYPSIMRGMNIGPDTIITGKKYNEYQNIIEELVKDDREFYEILKKNKPFIDYYVKNGSLPEKLVEYLHDNELCLSPNYQLFTTKKPSVFTTLINELFIGRKTDKKKSQEYALKAKEIHEEMVRRGLSQ